MNTPINFEIAKLLQEREFDGSYFHFWNMINHSGEWRLDTSIWEYTDDYLEAPLVAEVIMWLYEKYGIWISVAPRFYGDGSLWFVYEALDMSKNDMESLNNNLFQGIFEMYKTPIETYEAGIKHVLTETIRI